MADERGQAVTEYVLLLAVIVSGYLVLIRGLNQYGLTQKVTRALTEDFASAYRYGHTKAKGYEDGEPKNHPRITTGEGNFRIFLNPRAK
jgi:Flp pilus assembly pilin Flp